MPDTNEIQSAIDAGKALGVFHDVTAVLLDGTRISVPVVVVPKGYDVTLPPQGAIEKWAGQPIRKTGQYAFGEADSFIRYFNEHKVDDSRIFASVECDEAKFWAILNFHGAQASFNDHYARFDLSPTREWTEWMDQDNVDMTQAAFAAFLEDRTELFTDPKGADLLELVQTLEGKADVRINQAIKLQNGTIKISYDEDVQLRGVGSGQQAGTMEIPAVLNVSIQPFEGVGFYPLKARLRYTIAERKIQFRYVTINAHLVVRAIASDIVKQIAERTGVQPFMV